MPVAVLAGAMVRARGAAALLATFAVVAAATPAFLDPGLRSLPPAILAVGVSGVSGAKMLRSLAQSSREGATLRRREEVRREVLGGSRLRAEALLGHRCVSGAVGLFAIATVAIACAPQDGDEPLPVACGVGPTTVLDALEAAPRPVRIDGIPLSACLEPASDGADLQTVGSSLVGAASELAGAAERRPEGDAAMRLGYLVGAVQRGAGRANAQGINSELVRRVEQELALVAPGSRAVREGLRAGRSTG